MRAFIVAIVSILLAAPASAGVLVQENFDAEVPGANVLSFGPGWLTNTFGWTVGAVPGAAYSGAQYLDAPSRVGRLRIAYFDSSSGFNSRPAGENIVISDVKIYVPKVTDQTFGALFVYDQQGNPIGVVGADMSTGMSLSSATQNVHDIAMNVNAWNDLKIITDFYTGSIEYWVDGVNVGSDVMSASNLANGFGQAAMYENGFSGAVAVGFRFDDYQVQTVPEPTGVLLLLPGGLLLVSLSLRRPRQIMVCGR